MNHQIGQLPDHRFKMNFRGGTTDRHASEGRFVDFECGMDGHGWLDLASPIWRLVIPLWQGSAGLSLDTGRRLPVILVYPISTILGKQVTDATSIKISLALNAGLAARNVHGPMQVQASFVKRAFQGGHLELGC